MATFVQETEYRRVLNEYAAGQIANAKNVSVDSARFIGSGGTPAYPTSIPFGYAVGWVGDQQVARRVERKGWGLLNAGINTSVTTIPVKNAEWDPGLQALAIGEYLIIDDEWMKITAVHASGYTVERAQYSSTAASHADRRSDLSGDRVV